MSIETLLEAAKFLELQAQLQQKAREDELKEKLCVKLEQKPPDVTFNSRVHLSNGCKAEEVRSEPRPAPRAPSLPHPSMPITVIPIPVVTPNPSGSPTLPVAMLSPPAPPKREPHSPQERSAPALPRSPQPIPEPAANHKQPVQSPQQAAAPQPGSTPPHQPPPPPPLQQQQQQQQQQRYPGSIVSTPQQHALLPQPLQQSPPHNGPPARASPPDDGRQHYPRKRPGGAGTRESHNKLEQNRRAHLKECFETLKKNIPNIDEKKTSNLSVLRSALRYIQTLKRKEKEYEHDMERLAREKIATQQRLAELKNELSQWMDVMEIDRVLRQTVQPEEDQASTSTASEGEDIMEDDLDEETAPRPPPALPSMPQTLKPEPHKATTPPQPAATLPPPPPPPAAVAPATTVVATSFLSQHRAPPPQPQPHLLAAAPPQPAPRPTVAATLPTIVAATSSTPGPAGHAVMASQTPMVTAASLHPTVIAHASVSHPSVIQAVNHVIQGGAPKHLAHLAPSAPPGSVQLAPGPRPIGHITVHPVAHLGQHLPALYPQPVAVTQPAVISHIAHTLGHAHVNGSAPSQPPPAAAIVGKQTAMVAHHPQLVGQTVLNPVTMVTMPSFPISTLKLA